MRDFIKLRIKQDGGWRFRFRPDPPPTSANVSMTKTLLTAGPYIAGQTVSYTLVVGNSGPATATDIVVSDTPSNLTITSVSGSGYTALPFTIPSLVSGGIVSVTVTATIDTAGAFDNTATAFATQTDPVPANNTDSTGNGGTATAPPPPEFVMNVTGLAAASLDPITDILGASFIDVSTNGMRSLDPDWIAPNTACEWKYAEFVPDDTNHWNHIIASGGDGYNFSEDEAQARTPPKTIYPSPPGPPYPAGGVVLQGVGGVTYGFDFFLDDFLVYVPMMGITEIVVDVNIEQLFLQIALGDVADIASIDYTVLYAELAHIVSATNSAGLVVRRFQLSTELGINNEDDIIHGAQDVIDVYTVVQAHIQSTYPGIPVTGDSYNLDEAPFHYSDYVTKLNGMVLDGHRQYFHFDDTLLTFQQNIDRSDEFLNFVDLFTTSYTNGQKMCLMQSQFKQGNPMQLKCGAGLIHSILYMDVIEANSIHGSTDPLITDFTFYNNNRLISGNNTLNIKPEMYFTQLIRGMFQGDGKAALTFTGITDSTSLRSMAVTKGDGAEVYIVNPLSGAVVIPSIALEGIATTVDTESYYGNPTSDTATHSTENSVSSVTLQPYSLTKITIPTASLTFLVSDSNPADQLTDEGGTNLLIEG